MRMKSDAHESKKEREREELIDLLSYATCGVKII